MDSSEQSGSDEEIHDPRAGASAVKDPRFVNLSTGLWPELLSRFISGLPSIESRINALGPSLVREVMEPTHSFHAGIVSPKAGGLLGLIGGYCVLDEVEIHTFFLHPDWRNKGIGSAMFRRFLSVCHLSGISSVYLEVRSRSPARELYTRLGFRQSGIRKGYYGPEWSVDEQSDDAIVMVYTTGEMNDQPNPGERLMELLTVGLAGL